jgi:hypothetical protein
MLAILPIKLAFKCVHSIHAFACILLSSIVFILWSGVSLAASPYDTAAQNAATFLENAQFAEDGSWGTTDNIIPLFTTEAVQALYAYNRRTPHYYQGITWLENHRMLNVDYTARRIMALSPTKNDLSADVSYLVSAQNLTNTTSSPANNGWGMSSSYQGSPLDTALTLQALSAVTTVANTSAATTYLQTSQLTGFDNGWPLAHGAISDPTVTAQAVIALAPRLGAGSPIISNAINTLRNTVNTNSTVIEQALVARAYLAVNTSNADALPLLNHLQLIQAANGSIGADAYTTALALRAFAASAGKDLSSLRDIVNVPDQNLRNAINQALGKNALDNLNKGELANLITLNIAGRNVKSLVGLEAAVNLTYLDASNNLIASTAPISGLTNLAQVVLTNNPVTPPTNNASADVPTLPEWGVILMAVVLLLQIRRQQQRPR